MQEAFRDRFVEALRYVDEGRAAGKVVIKP